MYRMMNLVVTMIPADAVQERHYFMEFMQEPTVIWGIRILFTVFAVAAFLIYKFLKKNSGE